VQKASDSLNIFYLYLAHVDGKGVGTESAAERSQYTDETYMSTEEWLKHHGLSARKLGFYDVLSSVAFRHEDGVIDLKVAPPCDDDHIVDAVSSQIYLFSLYLTFSRKSRWIFAAI
jgi:hypothetical protein